MKRLSHSLFFAIAGILLLMAVAVASVTAGYLLAPQPAVHQTLPSGTNTIQFSCTIPVEVRIAPQFQTIRAVNSVPEGYRATATSGGQAITFTPYRGFVARPYLTCILPPGQNVDVVITDDHQRGWPVIVSVVDIWPLTEQEELIAWALVALLLLSSVVMMGIGIRKRKGCSNKVQEDTR